MIGGRPPSRLWTQTRRLGLLLLAPARVWRALRNPDFRRAYPAYAGSLRAALLVTMGALVAAVVIAPAAAGVVAGLLAAGALALHWRGRAGYGARRGLPPGPVDFLETGPFLDPRFYLSAARAHGPFFKCSALARSQVCVASLAAGSEILRTFARHLRPLSLPFHRFVPGGFLRRMEQPAHDGYRRLFSSVLSRSLVERWRPVLEASAARGLARLESASAEAGPAGTAPTPHVERLVRDAWLEVFLGVDARSDDAAHLAELFAVVDIRNLQGASPRAVLAALHGIETWIERASSDADGAGSSPEPRRSCVLREILDRRPDALRDATVVRNLIYVVTTSAGDVSGLLMWVLKLLGDHPDWAERLRRETTPEGRAATEPSLEARIVSETLRLQQSEFVMREIVRPFDHRGFRFPRGWLLRVCVQESHRDPEVFDRPADYDPDRFLRNPPAREQYAPFGLDRHACIGEHLARAMAEAFVGALARYDWAITADGATEMSNWRHWAPNSSLRVRLSARSPLTPGLTTASAAPDR